VWGFVWFVCFFGVSCIKLLGRFLVCFVVGVLGGGCACVCGGLCCGVLGDFLCL